MHIEEDSTSWQILIIKYLQEGCLPESPKEALKIKKSAAFYTIIDNQLFKRGYSIPLLKCVNKDQSQYVMAEVHEGVCGHLLGGRSLAAKFLRAGYYWPTMKADCMKYVQQLVAPKPGLHWYSTKLDVHRH